MVTTSEVRRDEAGTDEVVALASTLARLPHATVERDDEDGDLPPLDDAGARRRDLGVEPPRVLPRQSDEFTCGCCFLVAHVSRRAWGRVNRCVDCA